MTNCIKCNQQDSSNLYIDIEEKEVCICQKCEKDVVACENCLNNIFQNETHKCNKCRSFNNKLNEEQIIVPKQFLKQIPKEYRNILIDLSPNKKLSFDYINLLPSNIQYFFRIIQKNLIYKEYLDNETIYKHIDNNKNNSFLINYEKMKINDTQIITPSIINTDNILIEIINNYQYTKTKELSIFNKQFDILDNDYFYDSSIIHILIKSKEQNQII